jgi:hypothetical protein
VCNKLQIPRLLKGHVGFDGTRLSPVVGQIVLILEIRYFALPWLFHAVMYDGVVDDI